MNRLVERSFANIPFPGLRIAAIVSLKKGNLMGLSVRSLPTTVYLLAAMEFFISSSSKTNPPSYSSAMDNALQISSMDRELEVAIAQAQKNGQQRTKRTRSRENSSQGTRRRKLVTEGERKKRILILDS